MSWLRDIVTSMLDKAGEKFEQVGASIKIDGDGYVSDFLHHIGNDSAGGRHGHVWGLNSNNDSNIGGRSED